MTSFPRPQRVDLLAAGVVAAAIAAGLTGLTEASLMVAGVALTGWAAWAWRERPPLGLLASLAGGWLVVRFALADNYAGWRGAVGVAAVVAIAASVGRRERAGVSGRAVLACLAISCGGVWACVPETDGAGRFGLVLGVAAALAAVLDVQVMDELVAAGAAALMFVALAGGQYRASAVVGAVGVLGVLAVAWAVPIVPLRRGLALRAGLAADLAVVAGHGLNTLLAARIAGRGDGLVRPVAVAVVAGIALTIWLAVVGRTNSTSERRA